MTRRTLCQNLKIKSSTDRLLLPMTSVHTNQSCNLILSTLWYLKRWQGSVNNTFSWPKCQAGLGVAFAAYGTLMISGHERNQKSSSSSYFICSDFFIQFLFIFLEMVGKRGCTKVQTEQIKMKRKISSFLYLFSF